MKTSLFATSLRGSCGFILGILLAYAARVPAQQPPQPADCSNGRAVDYPCGGGSCWYWVCDDPNDTGPSCTVPGAGGSGSGGGSGRPERRALTEGDGGMTPNPGYQQGMWGCRGNCSRGGGGGGFGSGGSSAGGSCEPCGGMPYWWVEEPALSLYVADKPFFYNTSRGREIGFELQYKGKPGVNGQNDMLQPAIFSFGTNWHSPWRSYMQKSTISDPTADPTFLIFLGDGSARNYVSNQTEYASRATLTFSDGEFLLTFPSGSRNVYGQFVTLGTNEYIFLTRKEDSSSNATTFSYAVTTNSGSGVTNSIRLAKVTDEDNRETTFSYATNGYYSNVVTAVNGPYSLSATLAHDSQHRLTNLTDVVNLSSRIEYDATQRVSKVITPYGTNSFTYIATNGSTALLIDELGLRKQFYLAGHDRANVLSTAFSESAALNAYLGGTVETNTFETRNTFYWGPRQYQNLPSAIRSAISGGTFDPANLTTNDFKLGWTRHWLRARTDDFSNTNVLLSSAVSVERAPSPDTNGVIEGLLTWHDYPGKTGGEFIGHWEYVANVSLPNTMAYRNGTNWQVTKYTRNSLGKATRIEETYSVRSLSEPSFWDSVWTWTIAWRTNLFLYAENGIDLLSEHFGAEGVTHLHSSNVFNLYHQVATNYNALEEATVYEYNASHQLTNVTHPTGLIIAYTYDGNGFLSTVIERSLSQNFSTNTYTWTNGYLRTHTDPRGSVTTNTWDALGRLTQTANEIGAINHSYDKLDLVRTTDRMGFTNGFAYNGFRELVYQTNANFKVTSYQYCDCGALDGVLDALNNLTSYSYDNLGRLVRTTFPDSSWTENSYDLLNQVVRTSDSAGVNSTNLYLLGGLLWRRDSALGTVLRIYSDAEDRATNTMDGNGFMTVRTYDELGRLIFSDAVNNAVWEGDPYLWTIHRDSFGYSERGMIAHTNPLGQVTRYFYDELGRKTIETNANNEVTQFAYAPAGDLITLTDGKNQNTTWKYDVLGRVTNKLDHTSTVIFRYGYDANSRLTNRWTPEKLSTAYSYDAVGNLTLVNYPASSDITLKYDALNRLTNMLDGVGTTAYTYANIGALQSEDGPWENDAVSYSYTNRMRAGLSLAQTTGGAWTNAVGYDSNRRLKTITSPAGTSTYGYRDYENWAERYPDGVTDPLVLAGSLVESLSLPNGAGISTTHDILGRVTAKTGHAYSYDAAHRRTRYTRTGGDYVDYTYDDIGQVKTATGKELAGANRVHERFGYTYDAAGNLNYRTNNALVQTFNVDSLNQLTTATRSGNMTVAGFTTADATSVKVNANGGGDVDAIRYADRSFARTNVTLVNGNNTFAATAQDSLGRTDTSSVTVSLPSTVGYIYDLNGNLRTNGTTVYTYDDENQLTQVVVTNSTRSEFSYDGKMRRRVRKESVWANGDWRQVLEVRYIYDGNLVVQERHYDSQLGTTLPQRAISYTRGLDLSGSFQGAGGIGGLLARSELSTLSNPSLTHAYYHSDANGNVTAMADANQTVVARYLYDPFGGLLASSGPLAEANLYRFSSKEAHHQSGLVYYLYRYYEPQSQTWINRDPIVDLGFRIARAKSQRTFRVWNSYLFVQNKPTMAIDPDGLTDWPWPGNGSVNNCLPFPVIVLINGQYFTLGPGESTANLPGWSDDVDGVWINNEFYRVAGGSNFDTCKDAKPKLKCPPTGGGAPNDDDPSDDREPRIPPYTPPPPLPSGPDKPLT